MSNGEKLRKKLWIGAAASIIAISSFNNRQGINQEATRTIKEIMNETVGNTSYLLDEVAEIVEASRIDRVVEKSNVIKVGYSIKDVLYMIKEGSGEITESETIRYIKLFGDKYAVYLSNDSKHTLRKINSDGAKGDITKSDEFRALIEDMIAIFGEYGENIKSGDFNSKINYALSLIAINSSKMNINDRLRFLRAICTKYGKQIPPNYEETVKKLMQEHNECEIETIIEGEDVQELVDFLQGLIERQDLSQEALGEH